MSRRRRILEPAACIGGDRAPREADAGRRRVLQAVAACGLGVVGVRPVAATPEASTAAQRAFTGGVAPGTGRVRLDVAPLVENGNVVPVTLAYDGPLPPGVHVASVALFTERNPQSEVLEFTFGPRAARAQVSTRMRLAASQRVTAIARLSDGACWQQAADVVVTLAACIEGDAGGGVN